jgi:NADH dehydrogenase FAD-containing subunit
MKKTRIVIGGGGFAGLYAALRTAHNMKATQLLHDLGQSLWLDNITRDLLKELT